MSGERPACLIEAFVRDDIMESYERLPPGKPFAKGTVFLRRGVEPVVGAFVKLSAICLPSMNKEFGEEVSGCLMGGRVHTVVSSERVLATIEVTSLPAPEALDCGEWEVELVYDADMKFPWVVESMKLRTMN